MASTPPPLQDANAPSVPNAGVCDLPAWSVLAFEGPDAASFLQGQLTQDALGLDAHSARLAGYCNPKGRLMATGVLLRPQPECFWWVLPSAQLPALMRRLQMFVLRAKLKLRDAGYTVHGMWSQDPAAPTWQVEALDGGGWQVALPPALGHARAWQLRPAGAQPPNTNLSTAEAAQAAWLWLEVHAGLPWVGPRTSEHFVPQMLNWELLGGVNFKKGCYPGQEVVARSQYRGTVKRRTFLYACDAGIASDGPPESGQSLFAPEDPEQPAGEVVNAAEWQGRTVLLAEVKLAAHEQGGLRLGQPDGPLLHPLPLPYAVQAPE